MRPEDEAHVGAGGNAFPTTHWSQLAALGGTAGAEHRAVLNMLIERYWQPVYHYVRRLGCESEEAKDAVQEFFTSWLLRHLFERADPTKGRFRTFLLSCLRNFLSNRRRAAGASRRRPEAGFVSVRDLASDEPGFEPVEQETPEDVFNRSWASGLLIRVLRAFERECRAAGKEAHYEIFRRRIIEPALEGKVPPTEHNLGELLGLTEKAVANRLLTARRGFRRALEQEVRIYAASAEDAESEMRDLFQSLAKP